MRLVSIHQFAEANKFYDSPYVGISPNMIPPIPIRFTHDYESNQCKKNGFFLILTLEPTIFGVIKFPSKLVDHHIHD
jgi:hypothetical protein